MSPHLQKILKALSKEFTTGVAKMELQLLKTFPVAGGDWC